MGISAEQFAEIVRTIDRSASPRQPADRRRASRAKVPVDVAIVPWPPRAGTISQSVRLETLSSRGISFLKSEPMEAGEQFLLRVPGRSGKEMRVLCTVAHCRPGRGAQYSIGAEITCPAERALAPSEDEIEKIRRAILR